MKLECLPPKEGIMAIKDNRLPDEVESLESQKKFKEYRDGGLYEPIMGGPETQMKMQDKTIKSQEKIHKENMEQAGAKHT